LIVGFGYFFFAALIFAHLAFAAALILARPAALIFRFALLAGFTDNFLPLTLAHLALAAAEILARPAALILRFFLGSAGATEGVGAPSNWLSLFSSNWIFSFNAAARLNS
jgi:hypothetical protein